MVMVASEFRPASGSERAPRQIAESSPITVLRSRYEAYNEESEIAESGEAHMVSRKVLPLLLVLVAVVSITVWYSKKGVFSDPGIILIVVFSLFAAYAFYDDGPSKGR